MTYTSLQQSDRDRKVSFSVNSVAVEGDLHVPEIARGMVVFAHGSTSSRYSLRNRYIARILQRYDLATLLIDLRDTEDPATESQEYEPFDLELSVARLLGATDWLLDNPDTRSLRLGYLGANVGSGSAMIAATQRPEVVSAIVSRGRSPELDAAGLAKVKAPTLFVVGGRDRAGIDNNQAAVKQLPAARIASIPGATRHFEEPCALDTVAQLAGEWFATHLSPTDESQLRGSTLHGKVNWM